MQKWKLGILEAAVCCELFARVSQYLLRALKVLYNSFSYVLSANFRESRWLHRFPRQQIKTARSSLRLLSRMAVLRTPARFLLFLESVDEKDDRVHECTACQLRALRAAQYIVSVPAARARKCLAATSLGYLQWNRLTPSSPAGHLVEEVVEFAVLRHTGEMRTHQIA